MPVCLCSPFTGPLSLLYLFSQPISVSEVPAIWSYTLYIKSPTDFFSLYCSCLFSAFPQYLCPPVLLLTFCGTLSFFHCPLVNPSVSLLPLLVTCWSCYSNTGPLSPPLLYLCLKLAEQNQWFPRKYVLDPILTHTYTHTYLRPTHNHTHAYTHFLAWI